ISFAASPDGTMLATGSEKQIRLWDASNGRLKAVLEQPTSAFSGVYRLAFSPDGQMLASLIGEAGKPKKAWHSDVRSRELRPTRRGDTGVVFSAAIAPDGKTLATGSTDRAVRLWDLENGQPRTTLRGHTDTVFSVLFSPDGKTLATGSWDDTVRLWDQHTGRL